MPGVRPSPPVKAHLCPLSPTIYASGAILNFDSGCPETVMCKTVRSFCSSTLVTLSEEFSYNVSVCSQI